MTWSVVSDVNIRLTGKVRSYSMTRFSTNNIPDASRSETRHLGRFRDDTICHWSGGRYSIKMPPYYYREFFYKDNTVVRPSYIHNGNPHTLKYKLFIKTAPSCLSDWLDVIRNAGWLQCAPWSMNTVNYWWIWHIESFMHSHVLKLTTGACCVIAYQQEPLWWCGSPAQPGLGITMTSE